MRTLTPRPEEWADAPDTEPSASARPLPEGESLSVYAPSFGADGAVRAPSECVGGSRKFRPGIDDDEEPATLDLDHFISPE